MHINKGYNNGMICQIPKKQQQLKQYFNHVNIIVDNSVDETLKIMLYNQETLF